MIDKPVEKVLFLDLETTGLDPKFCSVLEVAAVVLDAQFQQLGALQTAVWQDTARAYSEMNDWCRQTHALSGLLEDVERSTTTVDQADELLASFVQHHFPAGGAELAGNSVHFDLGFIRVHMPRTAALLSHRVQDVSSATRIVRRFARIDVPQARGEVAHRAMPDVLQSIEQLKKLVASVRYYSSAGGSDVAS